MPPEITVAVFAVMAVINTGYSLVSYAYGAMARGFITSLIAMVCVAAFIHYLPQVL